MSKHRTVILCALGIQLCGCSFTPGDAPVGASEPLGHPFVMSATILGDTLVVERRGLRDQGLSDVDKTLELPAPAHGNALEYLSIDPSGEFLFISARSLHLLSFPNNQPAIHTVWIIRANPLELIREYALPKYTTLPYWVDEQSLRFEAGDAEKNCVDYRIGRDGKVSKTILREIPSMPTLLHATEAAKALNERGYKFVVRHPWGANLFGAGTFDPIRRNPIVSRDGKTIAANARPNDSSEPLTRTQIVVLRKRGEIWETKQLNEDGSHMFAIAGEWVVVGDFENYEWRCRIYDSNLERVVGEFTAGAFDAYGP